MWQAVYAEVKNQGMEFIAVAFDTGGKAAVEARIRCKDLDQLPAQLAAVMGWNDTLWARQAPPEYPCLIDAGHVVAELYGMYNVPQAVWIDEQGRIVRPVETAGSTDVTKIMDRTTFELPQEVKTKSVATRDAYVEALRDWAKNGANSRYVLTPGEVRKRMRGPSEADVEAANHVRLGRYLFGQGEIEAAKFHFREAVRLRPEAWNYRRQSMMLDADRIGQLNSGQDFWDAVDANKDLPFYPPADFSREAV